MTAAGRAYNLAAGNEPATRTLPEPDLMGLVHIKRDGNRRFIRGPSGRRVLLEVFYVRRGVGRFTEAGRRRARQQEGVYQVDIPAKVLFFRLGVATDEWFPWPSSTDEPGEVRAQRSETADGLQPYLWAKMVAEVGYASGGRHVLLEDSESITYYDQSREFRVRELLEQGGALRLRDYPVNEARPVRFAFLQNVSEAAFLTSAENCALVQLRDFLGPKAKVEETFDDFSRKSIRFPPRVTHF